MSKVQPSADTLRTVQDLHRFFDLHRNSLLTLRQQGEAAQRAHEEWLKANPPVPEDIVVNYFILEDSEKPAAP